MCRAFFYTEIMIRIENLHKNFGGVRAVDNASLQISEGTITGLIGPNGAGKSTLFNCIAGLHKPTSGRILLNGEDISGLEPHLLFEKGVLRTFQLAHEFKSLTVRENLMVVPHNQAGESLTKVWFSRNLVEQGERKVAKKANEVIEFLEISSLADELAGNLSGGQKKLLELGRTMMVEPKIVFLDEVGAGEGHRQHTVGAADLAYRDGSIYHAVPEQTLLWMALSILMTGVLLLGLIRREKNGVGNIGFESAALIVLYGFGIATAVFA